MLALSIAPHAWAPLVLFKRVRARPHRSVPIQ